MSSCFLGVITDAWVTLPTTGVDLFEGFTASVEAAHGGGKTMGCVAISSNSLVLGGITSHSVSLELPSSLIHPLLLVIFAPSWYTVYIILFP